MSAIENASSELIPLNRLKEWTGNPRQDHTREDIDSKKSSIRRNGLLQNLVACPCPDVDGEYVVIAGEGRRLAMVELVEAGEMESDALVRCEVRPYDEAKALELALTENLVRQQMKPIDESAAMAQLIDKGINEDAIAEAFGVSKKTVNRRLALGRLVPEARELIRNDERDLAWGAAMAAADQATQVKIVTDIQSNPESWKSGHDINRMLTADTIPVAHGLFDQSEYNGPIIQTLFDGDFYADRAEFWRAQDQAIDDLKAEIAAEGYRDVIISREPVQLWRWSEHDVLCESFAIIEALSNGKVSVHKGLVPNADEAEATDDSEEGTEEPHEDIIGDYIGASIRPTPVLAAHCAMVRTAAIQNQIAHDSRLALAVAVAGLIGEREIAVRGDAYRMSSETKDIENDLMDDWREMQDRLDQMLAPFKGANVLSTALTMEEDALQSLFSHLVAIRLGQGNPRRIDDSQASVLNQIADATGTSFPSGWRPDKAFFSLMAADDLRRIALAILPDRWKAGVETANKRNLVRLLCDAFDDAWNGAGMMSPEERRALMDWRPGPMSFPAIDEKFTGALFESESDDDPFNAIFATDDVAA